MSTVSTSPADLNSEDETGFVWTFLDEVDDPSVIRPGEVVVAGSPLTPAVCEVVDIVDKPAGMIVHLRCAPRNDRAAVPPTADACRRISVRSPRRTVSAQQPSGLAAVASASDPQAPTWGQSVLYVRIGRALPGDQTLEFGDREPDAASDVHRRDCTGLDQLVERRPPDPEQPPRLLCIDQQRPQPHVGARRRRLRIHRASLHTSVRVAAVRSRGIRFPANSCVGAPGSPSHSITRRVHGIVAFRYSAASPPQCPGWRSRLAAWRRAASPTPGPPGSCRGVATRWECRRSFSDLRASRSPCTARSSSTRRSSVCSTSVEFRPRPLEFALRRHVPTTFGLQRGVELGDRFDGVREVGLQLATAVDRQCEFVALDECCFEHCCRARRARRARKARTRSASDCHLRGRPPLPRTVTETTVTERNDWVHQPGNSL